MRPGWVSSLLTVFALVACHASEDARSKSAKNSERVQSGNLKFVCMHEADHWPAIDPEADRLFQYGRWLQKQPSPQDFKSIGRLYRIAAANGHYKAANNLQNLISTGNVDSPNHQAEVIDLVQAMIEQGIPSGYYAMGHFLEVGYGVHQDNEKSLAFFRKAADLGSADGQYHVAELLEPADRAPTIARQMRQCAVEQGHIEASTGLATDYQTDKLYPEAVKTYQIGIKNGNSLATLALSDAFKGPQPSDPIDYLALPHDEERVKRYLTIGKFLDRYDGRNPKVPDIDKIVPLPPAPLPAWDGTFQWEKEFKSAKAPEMPSEALIKKLAQAKGLDPATGLPLAKAK